MSTLGKICLSLTILLLLLAMAPIPGKYGGWIPRLLVFHNQWSEKLRDAKAGAGAAIEAQATARQELSKASTDIENQVTGWDRYWNIPARGPQVPQGAPGIQKRNGQLLLTNLGTDHGLVMAEFTDDNGARQFAVPVVHAFYGGPEGYTYAGEFVADPNNLAANRAVLRPVHPVNPRAWPENAAWRLRGMIPSGARANIDELHRRINRTRELTDRTLANITRQTGLLHAAEDALNVRKGELLGNPDGIDDPGRPEFIVGLLQAIEDFEEERNQLQLDVDHLRRSLNASSEERNQKLEALTAAAAKLPDSASSTSLEPAKVTGQPAPAN